MASFDVANLLNKITQDIPGINTVLKALAKWDVSALTDVPDGAMQATTDANNNLTIKKKVSGSYTPVAKLMHDVDKLDGYHASTSATANAIAVRNSSGALPGNVTGNAATADTATALAAGSVVPVNKGGTGATTASQARANLGVADGADFTSHIAKQASPSVEGHVKLDALAADGSNTAAPGGFGLGQVVARRVDNLDLIMETCFFSYNAGATGLPVGVIFGGFGFVISYNSTDKVQVIYTFDTPPRTMVRKRNSSPGWLGWSVLPNGITNSTSTTSSTIAASATAVKAVNDLAASALERTAPATTTSRGIARVATAADAAPGSTITNGPAFLDAAAWKISATPAAGIIPLADGNNHLAIGWFGSMLCNVRTVITVSGTFTVPISGWYRVKCIGGGGAGGSGGGSAINGGGQGGTTTFKGISAIGGSGGGKGYAAYGGYAGATSGGSGQAGKVVVRYVHLEKYEIVDYIVGAGGLAGASTTGSGAGPEGGPAAIYHWIVGGGARGASHGIVGRGSHDSVGASFGGGGDSNGTGYGGGGPGGNAVQNVTPIMLTGPDGAGSTNTSTGDGGNGGNGVIILEYFDPSVTS